MKKILAIMVITSLLNFAVAPAFAETQADRDGRQGRAVMGAIGLVALVGVFFMFSKMGGSASNIDEEKLKTKTLAQKNKTEPERLSAELDFANSGYYPDAQGDGFIQAKNEVRSPELKVNYAW